MNPNQNLNDDHDNNLQNSINNYREVESDQQILAKNTIVSDLEPAQEQAVPISHKHGKSKIIIISIVALAFILLAYATYALLINNSSPINSNGSEVVANTERANNSLGFKLLVPKNMSWERPQLVTDTKLFTYSNNVEFGQGIKKGSYGFYVYPKEGSSFNPPENCGLPGRNSSTIVPCNVYGDSNSIIKAYTINDQPYPGSIQNTSVKSYVTMYAENNGTIIVISSADTTPSNLYSIITSMKEISINDLPESSIISFN